METKKNNQVMKESVATGVGSAIGAAAGVAIASAVSSEAKAAETTQNEVGSPFGKEEVADNPVENNLVIDESEEIEVFVPEAEEAQNEHETDSNSVVVSVESPDRVDVVVTVNYPEDSMGEESVEEEPEVKVTDYQTFSDGYGHHSDIAVLDVGGQEMALVDIDGDGIADVAMADMNNNGVIEENEIEDVHEAQISMGGLLAETDDSNSYLAEDPDYMNDADIDGFYDA